MPCVTRALCARRRPCTTIPGARLTLRPGLRGSWWKRAWIPDRSFLPTALRSRWRWRWRWGWGGLDSPTATAHCHVMYGHSCTWSFDSMTRQRIHTRMKPFFARTPRIGGERRAWARARTVRRGAAARSGVAVAGRPASSSPLACLILPPFSCTCSSVPWDLAGCSSRVRHCARFDITPPFVKDMYHRPGGDITGRRERAFLTQDLATANHTDLLRARLFPST